MATDGAWDPSEHFVMDGLSPARLTESYVTETVPGAGIDAIHKTVAGSNTDFPEAIDRIRSLQADIASWSGVTQVRSSEELATGNDLGIVFGFQETTPFGRELDNVRLFQQLGIRIVQLTYNYRNFCGDGCTERFDGGLTHFGTELIDVLEAQGMLLDLSHAGERTALDALGVAEEPTIISHANASELCEHPRNISDELAVAIAETGGVVGVNAFPTFLGPDPTLDDLVDHIEYFTSLLGHEHVALGLDLLDNIDYAELEMLQDDPSYPDQATYPEGIQTSTDIPNIARALLDRDFSPDAVAGIMGENLRRVYSLVW